MSRQGQAGTTNRMRTRRMLAITCLAVLLWVFPAAMEAQILYGSLTGNVTDPSAAVVPTAHVQALNVQTGVVREVDAKEG